MIVIDASSIMPPFEQLRSQFAAQIASGERAVGAKLPTVRGLAAELGLAVNTVARAYRELEASGLVETRGRAGTVVAAAGDTSRERLQQAANSYAAVVRTTGMDAEQAIRIVRAALTRDA